MAHIDGDDIIEGDLGSYEEWNRLKNHWRGSAAPSNIQPGMIFGDEDDNKLYLMGDTISGITGGLEEILQVTRSSDKSPHFSCVFLNAFSAALSDPPLEAELEGVFGAPALYAGLVGLVNDSTSGSSKSYLVYSDGAVYRYLAFTEAL
jgi:hypothetical protein